MLYNTRVFFIIAYHKGEDLKKPILMNKVLHSKL